MSETPLLNAIRKSATRLGARLFRNNVGVATYPDGEKVAYGLQAGSSDLIGWIPVTVTPAMVGQQLAIFTSIEVKTSNRKARDNQKRWLTAVRQAGGIAAVVRSVEEAEEVIRRKN